MHARIAIALALSFAPLAALPAPSNPDVSAAIAVALATHKPASETPDAPVVKTGCPCGCATTGICTCADCPDGRGWMSYAAGQAEMKRSGKGCLIFVTADACAPCKSLEKTVASLDTSSLVRIKVNATNEPGLAAALNATSFPLLAVYGPDQVKRTSAIGDMPAETVRGMLAAPVSAPAATPNLVGSTVPASRGFFSVARRSGC